MAFACSFSSFVLSVIKEELCNLMRQGLGSLRQHTRYKKQCLASSSFSITLCYCHYFVVGGVVFNQPFKSYSVAVMYDCIYPELRLVTPGAGNSTPPRENHFVFGIFQSLERFS